MIISDINVDAMLFGCLLTPCQRGRSGGVTDSPDMTTCPDVTEHFTQVRTTSFGQSRKKLSRAERSGTTQSKINDLQNYQKQIERVFLSPGQNNGFLDQLGTRRLMSNIHEWNQKSKAFNMFSSVRHTVTITSFPQDWSQPNNS